MDQQDYGMFAGQVSEILDINANTLRAWSLELEKADYVFERNKQKQRIYYKKDVQLLNEMKNMMAENMMKIQDAITICMSAVSSEGDSNGLTGAVRDGDNAVVALEQRSNEGYQMMLVQQASERMSEMVEQQNYIVMQNKQIINMFLDEKAAKENAEIEREKEKRENEKLREEIMDMQSKLDKVVSFVEESADKNKSFLQKFFNRSPKKSL
ncbi:MerR family transcriptional regulator [Bacillus cereus group sp. N24]|uniref:MerR family transcriptional regulator n=1 Tax=Bacillus cereus group sp. N24 TaxID=2794592 RepID=UPI0018F793C5|nr:MerR family transcriptional regulator [Bacillus cereus group sp. N24]MBJ7950121.1 MerR family transcriptional regulator [Bacillus cereus group sp. N24]